MLYKYEIVPRQGAMRLKTDPYGAYFEGPPNNASVVWNVDEYQWNDSAWMDKRAKTDWLKKPVQVYEVHLGSWRRNLEDGNRPFTYRELATELVTYVKEMGFTHVEFMPLSEYPFEGSWGYQVTGFYAPTHRYGTPHDFMYLVDVMHQNGIGVILDWVPAHFPKDFFALAHFDGTHLYEHADPRQGEHQDWGTLIFNYSRPEVRCFLLGSAMTWLDRYHIDGLRVDAVASMLYLDYSRKEGQWIPNKYGGRENLEAMDFPALRQRHRASVLSRRAHDRRGIHRVGRRHQTREGKWPRLRPQVEHGLDARHAGVFQEGPHPPEVSPQPAHVRHDLPEHRAVHDGVLARRSGAWQAVHAAEDGAPSNIPDKARQLRALYGWMWGWPGKKTLFMGGEFAQSAEWRYDQSLDWHLLQYLDHEGVRLLVADLNQALSRAQVPARVRLRLPEFPMGQ